MSFAFSSQRQTVAWLVVAVVALALVWLLAPVLAPFLVGAVAAYALHPAVERLARIGVPRVLAVAIVEIFAILLFVALLLLMVPILSSIFRVPVQGKPITAIRLGNEVETLYTNGPAGGAGVYRASREVLAVASTYIPRAAVSWCVEYEEVP